jgi:hypothetical protein
VLGKTVIGMEVTIVEPWALVVVMFANVVGPVFVLDATELLELLELLELPLPVFVNGIRTSEGVVKATAGVGETSP